MTSLLGMITIGDAVYNYNRSSNPIAQGTPVTRRFAETPMRCMPRHVEGEIESHAHAGPALLAVFTSWETNGLQVGNDFQPWHVVHDHRVGMAQDPRPASG